MKKLALALLVSSAICPASAQTYKQAQWGVAQNVTPTQVALNINGVWYTFATFANGAFDFGDVSVPFGSGVGTISSASTTDLGSVNGVSALNVTGSTTINSFGNSAPVGSVRFLIFGSSLTLTNSSSLILPGGANISASAGDVAIATETASGIWSVVYSRASGLPIAPSTIVSSFNGRSGAVSPASGDYTTAQLTTSTSGSAPATGKLGEVLAVTGSPDSIVNNNVVTDLADDPLTAGDWNCYGVAEISLNTGTVYTTSNLGITSTPSVFPSFPNGLSESFAAQTVSGSTDIFAYSVSNVVLHLSSSATYSLVYQQAFSAGVVRAAGFIQCVRID